MIDGISFGSDNSMGLIFVLQFVYLIFVFIRLIHSIFFVIVISKYIFIFLQFIQLVFVFKVCTMFISQRWDEATYEFKIDGIPWVFCKLRMSSITYHQNAWVYFTLGCTISQSGTYPGRYIWTSRRSFFERRILIHFLACLLFSFNVLLERRIKIHFALLQRREPFVFWSRCNRCLGELAQVPENRRIDPSRLFLWVDKAEGPGALVTWSRCGWIGEWVHTVQVAFRYLGLWMVSCTSGNRRSHSIKLFTRWGCPTPSHWWSICGLSLFPNNQCYYLRLLGTLRAH